MLEKFEADDKYRRNFRMILAGVLMVKTYLCCFTQYTVDQSKLTVIAVFCLTRPTSVTWSHYKRLSYTQVTQKGAFAYPVDLPVSAL